MDDRKDFISPANRFTKPGSDASNRLYFPAFHRPIGGAEESRNDLPSGRTVVTCCFHGPQVSQGLATALRLMGVEQYLHPPYRLRLVGALKQLSPDRGPVLLQVSAL